jgi:hypothetical protein
MKKQSILVATLVMGLALPAFAQDGFRVGVQLGSMKTTGDNTQVALQPVMSGPTSSINTYYYNQPTQSPLSLDLAWVHGDDEFGFSFLTSKKSIGGTLATDAANPYSIGFLLGGGGYPNVAGSQEQKATIIDLTWKRALVKGDAGSFSFSTGLRYSKISDEFTNTFQDLAFNPQITIHDKATGTGFGLVTGLHGRMNFNDQLWMTTGFTAALLNNNDKTDDYTITQGGGSIIGIGTPDKHQSLLQTEAYLRINMNFVKSFNGYLGYEVKNYGSDSANSENLYTDLGLPKTHGFGLAGLTLGLSYSF